MLKRSRVNYGFYAFTTHETGWWYSHGTKSWVFNPDSGNAPYGTHQPCRTVKAFRRHLKKAPKGVRFVLLNRFPKHNVCGVGDSNETYDFMLGKLCFPYNKVVFFPEPPTH